ncbi:Clr5 domain-containing protein [Fusarium sp. Ph1]|nr:Clr5 domain-containing protein [Fusarium sp. Ph1]
MSSTNDLRTATDSDESRVAYDEMPLMDVLHLQQFDFIPLSQSQPSHPYAVLGEVGGEHLPGGSFSFPANDHTFTEQPIDPFDQYHFPSVPSQFSSMLLSGDLSAFGSHGRSMDSQNWLQQVEPPSRAGFGDETFASGPEWPSAPMETAYMPQNPWTGILPQQMSEELFQMTINQQSPQLLQSLEQPGIADLDYRNLVQAHSSGITYPLFTAGNGVEFEGLLPQPTPHIPSLACTAQNPQQIGESQILRSAHWNPGVSSYSDEAWEAIRPIFRDLFITQKCTLSQTSMVLELVHYFTATEDSFNTRKRRHWPDCVKNKTTATGTDSQILSHQAPGSSQSQQRPKKVMAKHPSPPEYVIRLLGSVPRALPPYLYKGQTILLLCIDKFVKGFYDSQADIESLRNPNQSGDYNMMLEEWEWRVLRTRCQAVSTLVRKHEAIPNPTNERPVALNRPERAETLKVIIGNLLHDKVFDQAQNPVRCSSPNQLSSIWDICRILQGLSLQQRHNDTLYVESFIHSLQDISTAFGKTNHVGMTALVEGLLGISPCDLQDTMRISFLCTARALSSRLGPRHPAVLESWTSYARHWDPKCLQKASFLSSYRKGLEETEKTFGHSHDYTINLLCNYASTAYYIFHDNGLASELANRLWERTSSACGNDETPLSWSAKAQGMAEAAKMLALLCCIDHENKRKSGGEMKKLRHKLKLKGRKARKRFRATLQSPPDPRNARQAIDCLKKTVERLDASEWDCKFVKAGLLDTLGNLTQEFCPKEVQGGAAKSHREEATGIRLEIVRNDQGEEQ